MSNQQPERGVPFQIPMRSSNGEKRWSAYPANRWVAGFETAEDAVRAADLVEQADELRGAKCYRRARALYDQVDELSAKGGLR